VSAVRKQVLLALRDARKKGEAIASGIRIQPHCKPCETSCRMRRRKGCAWSLRRKWCTDTHQGWTGGMAHAPA